MSEERTQILLTHSLRYVDLNDQLYALFYDDNLSIDHTKDAMEGLRLVEQTDKEYDVVVLGPVARSQEFPQDLRWFLYENWPEALRPTTPRLFLTVYPEPIAHLVETPPLVYYCHIGRPPDPAIVPHYLYDTVMQLASESRTRIYDRPPLIPELQKLVNCEFSEINEQTLRHLSRDPRLLYQLDPRKVEEVVAEIMRQLGYDVVLTPYRADGGVDIFAVDKTGIGTLLYVVEVKRYSPERKVGVGLVRSLYGVVEEKRANCGVLVTTSHFTEPARSFQATIGSRLSLKDFNDLKKWLAIATRL